MAPGELSLTDWSDFWIGYLLSGARLNPEWDELGTMPYLEPAIPPRFDEVKVRLVTVALLDTLVLAAFVAVGEISHGWTPWSDPARFFGGLAPFLLAWFVAAPLLGAYSPAVLSEPLWAGGNAAAVWLFADLLAQVLRSTRLFPGGSSFTFLAVSFGAGLLMLVPYRSAVSHLLFSGEA